MASSWIDLHTHSTASDGSFVPSEVVEQARRRGLTAIALTDHDCVDGLEEALAAGRRLGLEIIPGVEISAEFNSGTMHILGLFVDWKDRYFIERLQTLQRAREERNPQIAKRLQSEGLSITYDEVVAASGGGQVGRPHFAKVLIQKGHVATMEEAFDRYLKKGAPGYVEKFRYSPKEAVDMIHRAGGVAALAHPFTLGFSDEKMEEELIKELVGYGLDGLEVYYSKNSPGETLRYLKLCDALGLLPTGGSDFHGAHNPGIELGVGRGNLRVPYTLLEPLLSKARGHRGHRSQGPSG